MLLHNKLAVAGAFRDWTLVYFSMTFCWIRLASMQLFLLMDQSKRRNKDFLIVQHRLEPSLRKKEYKGNRIALAAEKKTGYHSWHERESTWQISKEGRAIYASLIS